MFIVKKLESYKINSTTLIGRFCFEPLTVGQSVTFGNLIKRTLINELKGVNLHSIKLNNLKHEYSMLNSTIEDTSEIINNIKDIVFKLSPIIYNVYSNDLISCYLLEEGPKIITAGLLKLPKNVIKVVNPEQYICTVTNTSKLYIKINLLVSDQTFSNYLYFKNNSSETHYNTDIVTSPIKNITTKTKLIYDSYGFLKESLNLEIITDGSITPERSLKEALKNIVYNANLISKNINF